MIIKIPFTKRMLIVRSPKLPQIILCKIPQYQVYGITNRTFDGKYLLFLDYDNVEDTIVKQDIKALQHNYKLGTAIVRMSNQKYQKTNNELVASFHVIFFTKLSYFQMLKILKETRCDDNFKKANFQQRVKVLRLSRKGNKTEPLPYMIIASKNNLQTSKAHADFFQSQDNIVINKYLNNLDKSRDIELINYLTA